MPKNEMEGIAYHEGNPGHHMQISIAQELTAIPQFRTQAGFTAYQEGWGLYAELLAKEMGGYQNDFSDFGRLVNEIWRAVRLVVDTGLHSKGWTEAEAIAYFNLVPQKKDKELHMLAFGLETEKVNLFTLQEMYIFLLSMIINPIMMSLIKTAI